MKKKQLSDKEKVTILELQVKELQEAVQTICYEVSGHLLTIDDNTQVIVKRLIALETTLSTGSKILYKRDNN